MLATRHAALDVFTPRAASGGFDLGCVGVVLAVLVLIVVLVQILNLNWVGFCSSSAITFCHALVVVGVVVVDTSLITPVSHVLFGW